MPCNCSCSCEPLVQTTNVPGPEGVGGSDGVDGLSAVAIVATDILVDTIGVSYVLSFDQTVWMAVGQTVVADGPYTFKVVSVGSLTTATLEYLGYPGDITGTIPAGARVSPAGVLSVIPPPLVSEAAGTSATITDTAGILDFGTTDPSLTINAPGTYQIFAQVELLYSAWKSTAITLTISLERTNDTPAQLCKSDIILPNTAAAEITQPLLSLLLPVAVYTTTVDTNIIEIWGELSGPASVSGSVLASAAKITAVKLY
jgi:hypothetical protein